VHCGTFEQRLVFGVLQILFRSTHIHVYFRCFGTAARSLTYGSSDQKYEGHLKSLWTGGNAPLLCRGRR
jgi:hypothetical protein